MRAITKSQQVRSRRHALQKNRAASQNPRTKNKHDFTFVDLFCGIGGFHQAAKSLGGSCVFACDIDEEARRAYSVNYGVTPDSDITKIPAKQIPVHDFLFAGFPCQPFSIIGSRKGFDDMRGTLIFEVLRIMKEQMPRFALLENVKQLATHNDGRTMLSIRRALDDMGYFTVTGILNALDYGLPQKRERVIIACFRNKQDTLDLNFPPSPNKTYKPLESLLDDDVDPRHYASQRITSKRKKAHRSKYTTAIWHENKGGHISSYPYSCALRAGASYNYLLVNGIRRLTPREMLRLQGYPEKFKIVCNDSQTRKQAGNSVPVPMVKKVISAILNASR